MSRVNLYKTILGKVASILGADAKIGADVFKSAIDEAHDSGFISGCSISSSRDLSGYQPPLQEEKSPSLSTNNISSQQKPLTSLPPQSSLDDHHPKEEESMKLYSGVVVSCISDSFSELSLQNPSLNNLGELKIKGEQPLVAEVKTSELRWDECFQQDEEDGDTPLHIAIVQGFIEIALALIRLAPHPFFLDTPNDNAESPMHLAVATKQPQIVRWLVAAGAKPSTRNIAGDSPLHIAARNGDLNCCRAIVEAVPSQEIEALALSYNAHHTKNQLNLEQWNCEGQTCVHVAATGGHVEVLSFLVQKGADINAREGKAGYTALHYAIESRNDNLMVFLLRDCGAFLNWGALTYGGRSALQLGCQVPAAIAEALRKRNVPSFYYSSSSSSEDESDSDLDIAPSSSSLELSSQFSGNLVNASA